MGKFRFKNEDEAIKCRKHLALGMSASSTIEREVMTYMKDKENYPFRMNK